MAFSLDTADFPSICNYEEADALWTKRKPWRSQPASVRPLEKRTKKHCQIIKFGDNDIRCRLHNTDLVYYSRGRIEVRTSYASISTDNFINSLLRRTPVRVIANQRPASAWWAENGYVDGALINGDRAIFDVNYKLQNPRDYEILTLDKTKSRELRGRYKYADFTAWRKAYETMGGSDVVPDYGWMSRRNPNYRPDAMRRDEVLQRLINGGDDWRELAASCTNEYVLDTIYRNHREVVQQKTGKRFATFAEFTNWRKLDLKYGWSMKGL